MATPFDHLASTYDSTFTHSHIGQLQRQRVWHYLEQVIPTLHGLEILELNCGTGTDAILFGDKGFNIIATDVSTEMLKATDQKIQQYSMQHKISSQFLDLDTFDETLFQKRFDLIFSNFGGLNCINPQAMERLIKRLPKMLAPGGRLVAIMMANHCLWETSFFLSRFRFRHAFRRWTHKPVTAQLNTQTIKTWYYNPKQLKKWATPAFEKIQLCPVGFFVPPSYLENFFTRKRRMLRLLNNLEKRIGHLSMLSNLSDHYLLDLKLKT